MKLYLVRHGIAIDRWDPSCRSDADRALTEEGVRKTREVAEGLRALGVAPECILTSPYRRTLQTAVIIARSLEYSRRNIRQSDALCPGGSPREFRELLATMDHESIMCVGHGGHLDEFIAHALGASSRPTDLKKSGVACLTWDTFQPGDASLLWLFTPKVLRGYGQNGEAAEAVGRDEDRGNHLKIPPPSPRSITRL